MTHRKLPVQSLDDNINNLLGIDLNDPIQRRASDDADARRTLIESLVNVRTTRGLSQTEVANRMGTKQPAISDFESYGSDPSLRRIFAYARAVGAHLRIAVVTDADCVYTAPTREPAEPLDHWSDWSTLELLEN